MSNLDRSDICPIPWLSMGIRRRSLENCCHRPQYASFEAFEGPWTDGSQNWFNTQKIINRRKEMLEHGYKARCPIDKCDILPHLLQYPTLRDYLTAKGVEHIGRYIEAGQSDCPEIKPSYLTIEPGLKCNMRCKFCTISDDLKRGEKQNPTIDQIQNLDQYFGDHIIDYHTCGGDTFAFDDEHIEALYNPIRSINHRVSTWVVTNGLGLTPERYKRFFVDGPINGSLISIHTLDDDKAKLITGVPFAKIRQNLETIANDYPQNCLGTISTVVMDINIDELPAIYEFAERCHCHTYRLSPVISDQVYARGFADLGLDLTSAIRPETAIPVFEQLEAQRASYRCRLLGLNRLRELVYQKCGYRETITDMINQCGGTDI